ncbi:hypothetical protein VSR01_17385 [Actinacidiphila sp. DG2A-62]|uniref:hypothetical protein n=1 Tax=Actinacidiphila sp. DG2A-62 TaxID=3108821 RepID=UPI002DBC2F19|nr:hypothetical protein [Actinacidiphila sp. DG2A-62]MEC3995212.1 hypothetical protein [Actinacidiphila sp. DG2A-62]
MGAYIAELEQIRAEQPPHNVMGTARYTAPDSPGLRWRNGLNGVRARALRDARRLRQETWCAGKKDGLPEAEVFRLGDLTYIAVLEASGAWTARVAELRGEHTRRYGPSSR